jgi:hypothetical protein
VGSRGRDPQVVVAAAGGGAVAVLVGVVAAIIQVALLLLLLLELGALLGALRHGGEGFRFEIEEGARRRRRSDGKERRGREMGEAEADLFRCGGRRDETILLGLPGARLTIFEPGQILIFEAVRDDAY